MVAQEGEGAVFLDEIDALDGVGAVADDVTQAHDVLDILRLDVFKHSLERKYIGVDVTDDRDTHCYNCSRQAPGVRMPAGWKEGMLLETLRKRQQGGHSPAMRRSPRRSASWSFARILDRVTSAG